MVTQLHGKLESALMAGMPFPALNTVWLISSPTLGRIHGPHLSVRRDPLDLPMRYEQHLIHFHLVPLPRREDMP